jgi:hypothetical protein
MIKGTTLNKFIKTTQVVTLVYGIGLLGIATKDYIEYRRIVKDMKKFDAEYDCNEVESNVIDLNDKRMD